MTQPIALIAFEGTAVDDRLARRLADPRVAGVTLFRNLNIETAAQTRDLTADLVAAAGRPLLIAVDQECGQLIGAGADTTPFAGNMALGATGDADLAFRVAQAIGRELAALGINVNYAPVADIATRPDNPSLGIRSFGEDPASVGRLVAATTAGLQSVGVAATLKHFPGKGEASVDPHYQLPVLNLDRARLDTVEFVPFRAGIAAGARLVMVGHYGLPAVTGDPSLPTSASPQALRTVLRTELQFDGLIVTDALDMGGFEGLAVEDAIRAGVDLLLYGPAQADATPPDALGSEQRLLELLTWMAPFSRPDLDLVGCPAHLELAAEVAARSLTLVRNRDRLLPLRIQPHQRILVVTTRPENLTPADTSVEVEPHLATAIKRRHPATSELIVAHHPAPTDIAAVIDAAHSHDVIVVGTFDVTPSQSTLVHRLLATGRPTVTLALRTPYDLAKYPAATTHVATYGILPPTLQALAAALFGEIEFQGRLPVTIPGIP